MRAGPGTGRARPGGWRASLAALGSAAGAALAGALAWGLIALLTHKQLSLIGLAIGISVGALVARFRPGHLPTVIAGAVIAVAGCALGTLLGQIFLLLDARVSLSAIMAHLGGVLREYPRNVGVLGVVFYLVAAYGAVRAPLRKRAPAAAGSPDPAAAPAADQAPASGAQPG